MEELEIFGDEIQIVEPRIGMFEYIFDNLKTDNCDLYLKVINSKNFVLNSDTITTTYKMYILLINEIFGVKTIYSENYTYIPLHILLQIKRVKRKFFEIKNLNIRYHLFREIKNIGYKNYPKMIKLLGDSDKKDCNLSIYSAKDSICYGMCTGILVNLYFLLIIVTDTNIDSYTNICGFKINGCNKDDIYISFDEMEVKSFDVTDNYNYLSGYTYFFNFTRLNSSEFLNSFENGTLNEKLDPDKDSKQIFSIKFEGDISKMDIYLFCEKMR